MKEKRAAEPGDEVKIRDLASWQVFHDCPGESVFVCAGPCQFAFPAAFASLPVWHTVRESPRYLFLRKKSNRSVPLEAHASTKAWKLGLNLQLPMSSVS